MHKAQLLHADMKAEKEAAEESKRKGREKGTVSLHLLIDSQRAHSAAL